MHPSSFVKAQHEARLLFALLDAVADDRRFPAPLEPRWRELKRRLDAGASFESEGAALFALLVELRAQGRLNGSWLDARSREVEARIAGRN